jgi:hypothetical protein
MPRSSLIKAKAITLHAGVASLPAPSDEGDGTSVEEWEQGGRAPARYLIDLSADAPLTLSGAYVAGFRDGAWKNIGYLNAGEGIDLTADVGWSTPARDLGLFSRLAVVGIVSANLIVVIVTPLE